MCFALKTKGENVKIYELDQTVLRVSIPSMGNGRERER